MDTFTYLWGGIVNALLPIHLFYLFIGVLVGVFVGALPGLGAAAGLAVLLPVVYGIDPTRGIVMLAGIYYGTMYGGKITSINLNTPGTPAAVATTLDGYPMAQKGKGAKAMGIAAFSSFFGGTLSVIFLTFTAPFLANFALRFGPPEYFALMVLALLSVASLTKGSIIKGLLSVFLGLLIATIGIDLGTGVQRFTYGSLYLFRGIGFIPVAMGLFGIAEIFSTTEEEHDLSKLQSLKLSLSDLLPSLEDLRRIRSTLLVCTPLGYFIGMLPGAGATIASFLAYTTAQKLSKEPDKFGEGVIEGVAAPECSNNAASTGAFVPLLTLGIPGSASTAVLMGALMMFGLRPGPLLFREESEFVWTLIGSMYIGNVGLILLVFLLIPLFVKILQIPRITLNILVFIFILVGAYSLENTMFDVGLVLVFGVLGYILKKLKIPPAPLILALVLGRLFENSLRQSLTISLGNPLIFFQRPISGTILSISFLIIIIPFLKHFFQEKVFSKKTL